MKVETLTNHLEYHWDAKNCKNHQKLSQGHNCYDSIMIWLTFPSPLVASMAYQNIWQDYVIGKVDTLSNHLRYRWDAKNCKITKNVYRDTTLMIE